MKTLMKITVLALVVSACSSMHLATSEYDDLYYSPADHASPVYNSDKSSVSEHASGSYNSNERYSEPAQGQRQDNSNVSGQDRYKSTTVNDYQSNNPAVYGNNQNQVNNYSGQNEESVSDQNNAQPDTAYASGGNTYITNNYYDDDYYSYASRIRRFHSPWWGLDYYDPFYYDPFGLSFGWNSWTGWNFGFGWPYYSSFYSPYYGYGYGYGYGGYGYRGWPYYGGLYDGYYYGDVYRHRNTDSYGRRRNMGSNSYITGGGGYSVRNSATNEYGRRMGNSAVNSSISSAGNGRRSVATSTRNGSEPLKSGTIVNDNNYRRNVGTTNNSTPYSRSSIYNSDYRRASSNYNNNTNQNYTPRYSRPVNSRPTYNNNSTSGVRTNQVVPRTSYARPDNSVTRQGSQNTYKSSTIDNRATYSRPSYNSGSSSRSYSSPSFSGGSRSSSSGSSSGFSSGGNGGGNGGGRRR